MFLICYADIIQQLSYLCKKQNIITTEIYLQNTAKLPSKINNDILWKKWYNVHESNEQCGPKSHCGVEIRYNIQKQYPQ